MKKIIALLVGLAFAFTLAFQAPAQAAVYEKSLCSSDKSVCMSVTYRLATGTKGIFLDSIWLSCDADHWLFGWDSPAVDGHGLVVSTGAGEVRYSLTDAQSNVGIANGNGECVRPIDINLSNPDAHQLNFHWTFTEKLNAQNDANDDIFITVINN